MNRNTDDARLAESLARLASLLDGAVAVSVDETVERARASNPVAPSRRGRVILASVVVVLLSAAVPAYLVLDASESEVTITAGGNEPETAPATSTTTDTKDLGLEATITPIDAKTISLTLLSTEHEVIVGAWQWLTTSVDSDEPQRYQYNLVADPVSSAPYDHPETDYWYPVDRFDTLLQGGGMTLPRGDRVVLTVGLPPGAGTGPHLLQILYGELGRGLVEVRFEMPET